MREQSLRANSSYADRAEFKPGQGKAKSSSTRSRRGINLGMLARELGGLDLLGAALGLSSEAVNILVDGRDHAREAQYGAHLAARMKDVGIPASWFDLPNPKISPEYLSVLRKFAATSNNKSPIRRANFRRIADAFVGREQVLADALEMVASAVSNVAEGNLELDDGRFGHINPILVRAGFPDGWLEQAEPDLTDAMLLSLEQLATDDYERKFEEDSVSHAGQVYVSPAPEQQNQQPLQPAAAPVDTSKETVMAPKPQQAPLPASSPQPPEFKAAGMPAAGKPMAHPTAGAPRLSRSVMAAGRKLPGTGAAKPAAKAASTGAKQASKPAQAPSAQAQSKPSTNTHSAPAQTPAPTGAAQAGTETRRGPNARGTVSKEVSLARAQALETLLETARRGAKAALWRDVLGSSLPFWGNIRRGAVLFRNELAAGVEQALGLPEGWLDNPTNPAPPLAAFMTDKDAPIPPRIKLDGISDDGTGAEGGAAGSDTGDAVGSAAGQAEATTAGQGPAAGVPPADGTQSASKTRSTKAGNAGSKRDALKPFAHSTAPQPPKVTMAHQPPSTPPVFQGATGTPPDASRGQLELVDMGAPAPGVALGTTGQGAQPAPAPEQTPAASSTPASATAAGQAGPLTQALMSIISAKAANGSFTETDALALINKLMAQ